MPDIYVSNYKYKAEKSLTTYINGIEVTSDYIEKSNGVVDDNYTTYDIPFVPNREFTITSSVMCKLIKIKNKCKIVESVLNMQNTQME